MEEEFNLSEKIFNFEVPSIDGNGNTNYHLFHRVPILYVEEVQEFIKRLKEDIGKKFDKICSVLPEAFFTSK